MARRKGKNFWDAMMQGLPMGFQMGMQNLRSREYAEQREKDRESREQLYNRQERDRAHQADIGRREKRGEQQASQHRSDTAMLDRMRIQAAQAGASSGELSAFDTMTNRRTATTIPSLIRGGSPQQGYRDVPSVSTGSRAVASLVSRQGEEEATQAEEDKIDRIRTELIKAGATPEELQGFEGIAFRDVRGNDPIGRFTQERQPNIRGAEMALSSLMGRDKEKVQEANRNAFYQLQLLDKATYARQSYNETVDYSVPLQSFKPDTSAADLETQLGHERAALLELQQTYPDEWGQRAFNPAAAKRSQYTQSLKELTVAQARPQNETFMNWLQSMSGGQGSISGVVSAGGRQGPPPEDPPVMDTTLSDTELGNALAVIEGLTTWDEKEQALTGLYGPNQIAQIKAKVGG